MSGVRRWVASALVALLAVVTVVLNGPGPASLLVAALLAGLAWALSPLFFPRTRDDAAAREAAAARGVPLIYWRPGCSYCLRLRASLGPSGNRAVWVDVSRDDTASARVREINGGNETVPTVVAGAVIRTNPDPSWVRDRLRA